MWNLTLIIDNSRNLGIRFVDVKPEGLGSTRLSVPESGTSTRLPDSGFDPTANVLAEGSPAAQSDISLTLESSETLCPR